MGHSPLALEIWVSEKLTWVDRNPGPIFHCFWAKIHQIKFVCVTVIVRCNAVFWLIVIKWRSCRKSHQNVYGFCLPNFLDVLPPTSTHTHPPCVWFTFERVAKFGDPLTIIEDIILNMQTYTNKPVGDCLVHSLLTIWWWWWWWWWRFVVCHLQIQHTMDKNNGAL